MVPLRVFSYPAFSASLANATLMTFGMYGLLFVLPLFLQEVRGEPAVRAGIGAAAAVDYLLFNVPNCRKSRQCVGTAPPHRSWNDTNRSGPFHARIHRCPVKLCHHRRIAIMPAHAGDHQRDCETLISFSVLSSQSVVSGVWTYDWDSIRTYRGFGEKLAERARLRGSDMLTPSSSPARGSC